MAPRLYMVDVFAERCYAGNPLAVVVGADSFADETLQRIAAEINFSETAFLGPAVNGDAHPLRLFTPAREIAFAGHPILGAAWVVRRYVLNSTAPMLHLRIPAGDVRVCFEESGERETAWFRAPPVSLQQTCDPLRIAQVLGLGVNDLVPDMPVQVAAAGTAAIIVPLRSLDALRRARPDPSGIAGMKAGGCPPLLYLFCRETLDRNNDLSARFFFEANGMREDPATGNGAAFLGAYLLEHGGSAATAGFWRIEQGHGLGRPSLVLLQAGVADGAREIRVGGRVIPVSTGELCGDCCAPGNHRS